MRPCLPSPRARRGLIALLALLGQAAGTFGMPLPSGSRRKDASRPFPCMSHSCGCMNIDEFWHSCCCYTNAQKLAWAEANGVYAPDFVREAAQREEAIARKAKKKSCFCDRCAKEKKEDSSPVKWVFGFAARRCGGHGPFDMAQYSPSVPARIPGAMNFDLALLGMLHSVDRQAQPLPTAPLDPPPRIE
jgi:hypothetical protein